MRWSIFSLLVALVGFTSALSASGNRLLVVLEDSGKQGLYSKFWTDLKCELSCNCIEPRPATNTDFYK